MVEQLLGLWPTKEAVSACIKKEAEAISEAVFLAVHQPMTFKRRDVGAGGATVERSENDLLHEFLTPDLPEGRLILPIVGSSGVGKSHVIRWLAAQLARRGDAHTRHVIRVPKGSSLKGVLRLLLRDLEGPAYDRLRDVLSEARDHLDPEKAAHQLQTSLRFRLKQEGRAATERIAAGTAKAGDKALRTYGDQRMLPALLADPLLEQEHWLTRGDKPGVIRLLAEQVTQEGSRELDERQHEFVPEDLVLDESINLMELSAQACKCYQALHRDDDTRRNDAACVLNRILDEAKNDLLHLGDNSLVELFADVRAELLREGQRVGENRELIFLVEDFAVLSGLQGALLQVMIAEATRDGKQTLCTMRTALAYTEGYMAGRDTVLTRATSEWLLEDRPGGERDILSRTERLVGAYLNAARVGQAALQQALASDDGTHLKAWVPRIGLDDLEPDASSIAEDFGTSEDGYPLFPFNRQAIEQLARRGSVDARGLVFNPRLVINNVLTRTLQERDAFTASRFPPEYLADTLRSATVRDEVGRRVTRADLTRYLTCLRLWGGQPETPAQAAAMPSSIYVAFSLRAVDFGVEPEQRTIQPTVGPKETTTLTAGTTALSVESTDEREWREALERWANGSLLDQHRARVIRKSVADAMLGFLPTDPLLLRPRQKRDDLQHAVYLPRVRTGRAKRDSAFVVVATKEELDDPLASAAVVSTLLGLIRRYELHGDWNYDGAEVDGGRVHEFLLTHAERATTHLREFHFGAHLDATEALVRVLGVGARALGIKGAHDRASDASLLAALLGDAEDPATGVATPWAELQRELLKDREAMRDLLLEIAGARQGGAKAVHAVDLTVFEPFLRALRSDWSLGDPPPQHNADAAYERFVRSFTNLLIQLEKSVRDERTALAAWLEDARDWFGDGMDKKAVQQELRDLVTEVKRRGVTRDDWEGLRRLLRDLPSMALGVAASAAERLSEDPSRGETLSILADLPGRDLERLKVFMVSFDSFMQRVDCELEGRETSVGLDVVEQAVAGLQRELEHLQTELGAIAEVGA